MFTKTSTFLRDHLTPINTLVLPFTVLNGFLDFLGDTATDLRRFVFAAIFTIFIGMIWLAIREKRQAANTSRLAEQAPSRWNRPFTRVLAAFLGVSALFGSISLAYASKGGMIANAYPPLKEVQQAMLGVLLDVKADTAEIKAGVAKISQHMDNPRAQLKSRGYEVTSHGLLEAIKQRDEEAVALFSAARLRVDQPEPLGFLLDSYWDAKIAGLLTEEMFTDESACINKNGAGWQEITMYLGMYMQNLRPDQPEKAATFKRLCKSTLVRESLERRVQTMPETGENPELLAQYRWALNYLSK